MTRTIDNKFKFVGEIDEYYAYIIYDFIYVTRSAHNIGIRIIFSGLDYDDLLFIIHNDYNESSILSNIKNLCHTIERETVQYPDYSFWCDLQDKHINSITFKGIII